MVCFALVRCSRNNGNIVQHLLEHHPKDLQLVGLSQYFLARDNRKELERQMPEVNALKVNFNIYSPYSAAVSVAGSGFSS